jgi:hypothetical protein
MRAWVVLCLLARTAAARPAPTEDEMLGVILYQPRAPYAESYAQQLLDKLNAEGRFDELAAWTDRMLAMPKLLRGRSDLAILLQTIQVRAARKRADDAEARAVASGSEAAWRRAGDAYATAARLAASRDRRMVLESWFNAGIAYAQANETRSALASFGAVIDGSHGTLHDHAQEHVVHLLVRLPQTWTACAFGVILDPWPGPAPR